MRIFGDFGKAPLVRMREQNKGQFEMAHEEMGLTA
jgi:hypothetical protein